MQSHLINLKSFGKQFSISSGTLNSICSSIGIETHKEGRETFTTTGNTFFNCDTDILLLYAFYEYKSTGKLQKTLSRDFSEIKVKVGNEEVEYNLEILKEWVGEHRHHYLQETAGTRVMPAPATSTQITPHPPAEPLVGREQEQLVQLLATAVAKALPAPPRPVLEAQEELDKAVAKRWLLTTEQLATLLQMTRSTIASKKSGWRKLGYEFEKLKEGSTTLWRITKYDL
jgi:hypothetical protein